MLIFGHILENVKTRILEKNNGLTQVIEIDEFENDEEAENNDKNKRYFLILVLFFGVEIGIV